MYTNEMAIAKLEEMGMCFNDACYTLKVLRKMNTDGIESMREKYKDNTEALNIINNIDKQVAQYNSVIPETHMTCYKSLLGGTNFKDMTEDERFEWIQNELHKKRIETFNSFATVRNDGNEISIK